MPLDFPTSPNVGDTYGRWEWNGTAWVTAPGTPSFPSTGGTIAGDVGVTGDLDVGGEANVSGDLAVDGDLTVQGEATFVDGVSIDGEDAATKPYVDNLIEAVKNLGHFAGSFNTHALLPTNTSAFLQGLTVNDFVTVRADETQGGATTRYVATTIAGNGDIIWTYDVTYSTDVSGKMDKVPTATAGNVAVFDASGQVEDAGSALDATSLQFRPMTADLHNWIPNGTVGMFVGEGNPTNSPPGFKRNPSNPLTGITKWRFTCTSDGDAMHMVAESIGTRPDRARRYTKMKKAGDTWDFTWIEYPNTHNFKFAGRNAMPFRPTTSEDAIPDNWPMAWNDRYGHRISHRGLMHTGVRITDAAQNRVHQIENIWRLEDSLQPGWVWTYNTGRPMPVPAPTMPLPTPAPIQVALTWDKSRNLRRIYRYKFAGYTGTRTPFAITFNVTQALPSGGPWVGQNYNDRRTYGATVVLSMRDLGGNYRWVDWSGRNNATDATQIQGIGFLVNGTKREGTIFPTFFNTPANPSMPNGLLYVIDFDFMPRSGKITVSVRSFGGLWWPGSRGPPC